MFISFKVREYSLGLMWLFPCHKVFSRYFLLCCFAILKLVVIISYPKMAVPGPAFMSTFHQ